MSCRYSVLSDKGLVCVDMVSIHYDVYQYSSCADESQPVHDRMAMPTNIITSFMMHSSIQVHGLGLDKQGSYLRR